uniref:C2H2-type domain-containing protein n=1 Tax=Chelonoidis abingdonii TaxID=106734 RepID=A0A8C0GPF3_CHEAB
GSRGGERPFTCADCGRCFSQSAHLAKHRRLHGTAGLPTPPAERSYSRSPEFLRFQRAHVGQRPFACPDCGKRFSAGSSLRTHTGERPYQCTQCGRHFSRRSNLGRHLATHSMLRGDPAPEGEPSAETLRQQGIAVEGEESQGLKGRSSEAVTQKGIPAEGEESQGLKGRSSEAVTQKGIPAEGEESQGLKGRSSEAVTQKGIPAVTQKGIPAEGEESQGLKGRNCGKGFAQRSHLLVHRRVHTGERPFPCPECGKRFRQSSVAVLLRHRAVHSGERPYCCMDCGRGFSLRANLLQHRRLHARHPHAVGDTE